jgi:hypothetical protein
MPAPLQKEATKQVNPKSLHEPTLIHSSGFVRRRHDYRVDSAGTP